MLWNRTMDGSVTGVNLVAVAENKGVWWSKVNNAMNENHNAWFLFFYKSIQKIKQIALFRLPRFWNESGANATQTQIQTHLSKDPLLNWRCQHLISHTLTAFQNPVWHNYSKQRVSSIFISQGSLIFLPVLIFQNPPTKYYISLCLALWTASIPDAISKYVHLSYRISQITYLHEWVAGRPSFATDTTVVSPPRW